ncbi:hypothetical protein QBC45DRAFT_388631 [Copromyces sp. CBS 386.78]|nr:hypothetical protein QBC45DRAFT_388631 [Copromyces sp. CBS 386.78]
MTPTKVEEITNPRRILAVALTDSSDHLGAVIRDLTGTAPTPQQQQQPPSQEEEEEEDASEQNTAKPSPSLAGTTHALPLSTPYYTASIPIWLDLISSPAEWSASFLSEEAKEVLGVLGGVVCVFEVPSLKSTGASSETGKRKEETKEFIKGVGKVVREGLGGWEWEGVSLAVGVTAAGKVGGKVAPGGVDEMEVDMEMEDEINEWEDLCAEWGLEFVHHQVAGPDVGGNKGKKEKGKNDDEKRNEYGEKMGIARVLEALQSNDWSGGDGTAGSTEGGGPFGGSEDDEDTDYIDENDWDTEDEFDLGFGYTKKQKMEMRKAFWKGTEESDKTTEEDLKAFRSVMQTVDGSRGGAWDARMKRQAREGFWKQFEEEVKENMKEGGKGDGKKKGEKQSATDTAKAGPSAGGSGSGATDKVKKEDNEEEEIGEEDVEKIAKMMLKLQAVRDMSGTVSEEQRRKLALKAVEEVMRQL